MRNIAGIVMACVFLMACWKQEPVSVSRYGLEKGAGSVGMHTVLRGDTVYKIAQNYQLPMREIITLNNMSAPYVLNTGFRMKLPPPNEYEVRQGDTITSIARMYELSANRLVSLNDLNAPYHLMVGQKLRLPMKGQSVARQEKVSSPHVQNTPVQNARIESVERQPIQKKKTEIVYKEPVLLESGALPGTSRMHKASVRQAQIRPKIPQKVSSKYSRQTPRLSGKSRFMHPVDGRVISSYGSKANGLHNDGINIKAARGAPVRATENGVVVYTGSDLDGYGNLVLVRHEGRIVSAYAHLDKTLVKRGDKIARGQALATVGSSGNVSTPQLHFEIRKGTQPLNPDKYL